jgi:MATE family multidrug resistance protein
MIVEWARAKIILNLSLPIVLVLLAQNLMSLIGMAMVGYLDNAALAGTGIASALFSMLLAMLFGIDTGVQAIVARLVGHGSARLAGYALNDALAISSLAGLLLTAIGYAAGPGVFAKIADDPAVVARGMPYLNAALPMLLFQGATFAFSAYRNGAGTPKLSLLVTAIQLPCSVLFSYVFIFGAFGFPRMETAGAGLGVTLAAFAAFIVHVLLASRLAPIPGFLRTRPRLSGMQTILKMGLPVGLQQSLVYLGTSVNFAIIGLLGTREVAAANVILGMLLLSILPATGMGIAAATLVGRALGRNQSADAKRWGWEVAQLGAVGILALTLTILATPRGTLGIFIDDNATVELAAVPLTILALGMSIDAFGRILGFAIRGTGATKLATSVAFVMQWCLQLPLSWYIGVYLGFGLTGISVNRIVLFAVESGIVAFIWHRGFWNQIHISGAQQ